MSTSAAGSIGYKKGAPASPAAPHAWLIGASSGMGLELGRLLSKAGWKVTLSARNHERLAQAAASFGALTVPLDITDKGAVAACAEQLFQGSAPTLVLVNAGDYEPMPLQAFDIELFERLNRVNYLGAVYVLGAVLPLMRDGGGGQVLLNASAAGFRGLPQGAPYSAPKAATIHLAESLHPEAARWGIRLRVINPGFVDSRLTAKNSFHMPGLMQPEDAARRILAALDRSGFEISFPRRLVWPLKLLRCLPYRIFFWLVDRRVLGA
ncbi:MAG: SDR family NAD(P)-dependent oxidoreductase [Sedimenticolaceae bacterium]